MPASRFRRLFHRPSEIVIGYDEGVVNAASVAAARDRWTGGMKVRTMPFRRVEADPAAPLLITLGDISDSPMASPPREVGEALAAALREANVQPLRLMVRFDYHSVIVRGDIQAEYEDMVARALVQVPDLAARARQAIDGAPRSMHLLIAGFDAHADRWVLLTTHGFDGKAWVVPVDSSCTAT